MRPRYVWLLRDINPHQSLLIFRDDQSSKEQIYRVGPVPPVLLSLTNNYVCVRAKQNGRLLATLRLGSSPWEVAQRISLAEDDDKKPIYIDLTGPLNPEELTCPSTK